MTIISLLFCQLTVTKKKERQQFHLFAKYGVECKNSNKSYGICCSSVLSFGYCLKVFIFYCLTLFYWVPHLNICLWSCLCFYHTDFKFNQWFVCVCDWFWCFKIDQSFTISHIVSAAIVVQSVFRCKSHYSVFRLSKTYFCSIDKLTCFCYSIVGIRFWK